MRIILFALSSMLLALSAIAADKPDASLFFTPAEIYQINTPGAAATAQADIRLGAVLYYGPQNWTVWLDGERWTPATQREDLEIIEVRPQQVRLQLPHDPGRQPFVLHPYQTYRAATGTIVEGLR